MSNLNVGQQAAADAFFQFLFGKEKAMGISGPGGVGKTHTMGHMIDVIMPQYLDMCKLTGIAPEYDNVHMTATTNKAAEVLGLATSRPCTTVHSFMNLKVREDFKTGRSIIEPKNTWKVHERTILFVDECSMIDTPLEKYINDGTHKSKIVYVGDHCQMAPVMEKLSPVYRKGIVFHELTEPMRTNIPELQALNQQIRNTVETGEFKPIKIIPGIIDHFTDEQMELAIKEYFFEQNLDSRILAYTNKRVVQYNDHIRNLRGLPSWFTVGENLVSNDAIKLGGHFLSVEDEVTIEDQDEKTQLISIDSGVELEIRITKLMTRLGVEIPNVMLPVDRNHFTGLKNYYAKQKNWERMYYLKNTFPELRQRDASTVYKAQGSTLETVFIDASDISACRDPDQAARQMYVAPSRARQRVIYYGDLASKYGGFIY